MDNSCLDLVFPSVGPKEVVARFDGGEVSSDAGILLLEQADRRLGLSKALASCVEDQRQQRKVEHAAVDLIRERVFAIAAGYEDANDLDDLRFDPVLKLACGRRPASDADLASQPTLSRLENRLGCRELMRMAQAMAERVVAQLPRGTRSVIVDVDATEDPCHGQQEFEFFNGYYGCHCYLPLYFYVTGPDGRRRLLGALLRPGNAKWRAGLFVGLRLAVRLLRARFPRLRITLRTDAGFGFGETIAFCRARGLHYVLGLRSNARLEALSAGVQERVVARAASEGEQCREFDEFEYRAGPWLQAERVVVKAEVTQQKVNPRYVVTDLGRRPQRIYDLYCERGDVENRIKESKLDLSSGRTSCHRFLANQARLIWHTAACVLMQTLQDATAGTQWAHAQIGTLRLRLLKVAARVIETCRRIWLHLPTSYPHQQMWRAVYARLVAGGT
jgi:hypothetical protein